MSRPAVPRSASLRSDRLIPAALLAFALAAPAIAADAWYPSRYGADDTLGAINLLSAEKVLQAVMNPVAIH